MNSNIKYQFETTYYIQSTFALNTLNSVNILNSHSHIIFLSKNMIITKENIRLYFRTVQEDKIL